MANPDRCAQHSLWSCWRVRRGCHYAGPGAYPLSLCTACPCTAGHLTTGRATWADSRETHVYRLQLDDSHYEHAEHGKMAHLRTVGVGGGPLVEATFLSQ